MRFRDYATDYLEWAQLHKRGWMNERAIMRRASDAFGNSRLDELTTAEVEVFLDGLLERLSRATRNRHRDGLSAMFKQAVRLGLLEKNAVTGIPKFREPEAESSTSPGKRKPPSPRRSDPISARRTPCR